MTLFNQINSLLFALFLLVMSSLVYFQFTETKSFMVNQMDSDLNNTVTSLSLMLKTKILHLGKIMITRDRQMMVQ